MSRRIDKTDEQWREQLTPAQYHVLRRKGSSGDAERRGDPDRDLSAKGLV